MVLTPIDREITHSKYTVSSVFSLFSHLPSTIYHNRSRFLAVKKERPQNEKDTKHLKIQIKGVRIYELQMFPSSLKRIKYKNPLCNILPLQGKGDKNMLPFSVHITCVGVCMCPKHKFSKPILVSRCYLLSIP